VRGDALVFPGQGAQAPGMGTELVERRCSLDLIEVAEAEGVPLRWLLLEAGAEDLRQTEAAQPTLFYTGVALYRLLSTGGLVPGFAAGHSLGEYCALVAAGALTPEAGMRLVIRRARAMASAPPGTMAAVLGLAPEVLESICTEVTASGALCVLANDNSPQQQVVSGSAAGVEEVSRRAREAGARRVVPLQVGGAFHSPLMAGPAALFAPAIAETEIAEPSFPVGVGAMGRVVSSAAEIRRGLEVQLESPVLWTATVLALEAAGAQRFLECGAGATLGPLIKRVLEAPEVVQVDSPQRAAQVAQGMPA
jgi:[acyl-carrier-protein] S-malonyltransferase